MGFHHGFDSHVESDRAMNNIGINTKSRICGSGLGAVGRICRGDVDLDVKP